MKKIIPWMIKAGESTSPSKIERKGIDMKTEALKKMRNHTIVNAFNKEYPRMPTINTTDLHIQIYNLVDEYINLYADLSNVAASSSKKFIEERMRKIEVELTDFWIVPDSEMITPTAV